jgi:chitinase
MYREFDKESQKSGKSRLLSSIATAAGQYLLKQGYDIPMLCKWLDMVNIMTYVREGSVFQSSSL